MAELVDVVCDVCREELVAVPFEDYRVPNHDTVICPKCEAAFEGEDDEQAAA